MACSQTLPRILNRDVAVDSIDSECKNKFRWDWLTLKDEKGNYFSDYFRKIYKDGFAWCCYCKAEIKYGNGGVRCLKDHANRSNTHKRNREIFCANQCLPAAMQAACSRISGTAESSRSSQPLPTLLSRPRSRSSSAPAPPDQGYSSQLDLESRSRSRI